MLRRGITLLVIVVIAAALIGTWKVAYQMGTSDGRNTVTEARNAFQTRVASAPQAASNTGGTGGTGGGARGSGGGSAAAGSGGNAAGGGTPGAGGTSAAGGAPGGTTNRGGGNASGNAAGATFTTLNGRVTKVDGGTLSIQQPDNATVSVTTNGETAVRKLVAGALTDLKAGDLVSVDGAKAGDAFSAKTITSLGAAAGGGGGGTRPGGGQPGGAPSASTVTGQIKTVDGGTITLQGSDGTMTTVSTSPSTLVRMQQPGVLTDIKTGDMVLIQGEKTSDTVLARSITNQGASSG